MPNKKIYIIVFFINLLDYFDSHASRPFNHIDDEQMLNFTSAFMLGVDGKKLVTRLPVNSIKDVDGPLCLEAQEYDRSEDTLMLLNLKDTMMASGISEGQKHFMANTHILEAFQSQPVCKIPGESKTGLRRKCDADCTIKGDSIKMSISLLEARGTITLMAKSFELNTFFMPMSLLILKPPEPEGPLKEIIFCIANNQLPMRIIGRVYFMEYPIIELETMNVSSIKINKNFQPVSDVLTNQ